jgi:hypothetical protein
MGTCLLLGGAVALRLAAAMAGFEGGQPFPIEAGDQLPDGIAASPPDSPSGVREALTISHCKQPFGSCHEGSRLSLSTTQTLQVAAFLIGEHVEGTFLAARHQGTPWRGMPPLYPQRLIMATLKASDPVVGLHG